jgi:hypothetical protein
MAEEKKKKTEVKEKKKEEPIVTTDNSRVPQLLNQGYMIKDQKPINGVMTWIFEKKE